MRLTQDEIEKRKMHGCLERTLLVWKIRDMTSYIDDMFKQSGYADGE